MKFYNQCLTVGSMALLSMTSAWAASSGSCVISGTVLGVNDIVVTPNPNNNSSLNITAGDSAKNVASVAETSNNPTGYKIFVSSTNAGKLQRTPSDFTTYQVSYDGASYATPSATPVQAKNVSSLTGLTTNTSVMLVNVTAKPAALAGTYTDTITLSIVANP